MYYEVFGRDMWSRQMTEKMETLGVCTMLTLINSGGDYAAFFAVQIRSICGNYKSDIKQLFVKKNTTYRNDQTV